jgi:DNA gyrase/topoisomerase IV subunit B
MAKTKQDTQLKSIVKSAISELIEENQEMIQVIIEEAIEQAFMTRAIKIGKKTKKVSKNRIFDVLTKQAT